MYLVCDSPIQNSLIGDESIVERDKIASLLSGLSLPKGYLDSALRLIPHKANGILVYGSRARGDSIQTSDLDLLALLANPRGSRIDGHVTLSVYTPAQLVSASGTLFGMHLSRDSKIIHDTHHILASILQSFRNPDPEILLSRVRHYSALLDVSETDRTVYLTGIVRLARYLLRTAIYALALKGKSPCFSVRELADRFSEPELVYLLSSDPAIHGPSSEEQLAAIISRLVRVIGGIEPNPHGSLHALIVNEWDSDRKRATLATLAMASPDAQFDYAVLPKVLL